MAVTRLYCCLRVAAFACGLSARARLTYDYSFTRSDIIAVRKTEKQNREPRVRGTPTYSRVLYRCGFLFTVTFISVYRTVRRNTGKYRTVRETRLTDFERECTIVYTGTALHCTSLYSPVDMTWYSVCAVRPPKRDMHI